MCRTPTAQTPTMDEVQEILCPLFLEAINIFCIYYDMWNDKTKGNIVISGISFQNKHCNRKRNCVFTKICILFNSHPYKISTRNDKNVSYFIVFTVTK